MKALLLLLLVMGAIPLVAEARCQPGVYTETFSMGGRVVVCTVIIGVDCSVQRLCS